MMKFSEDKLTYPCRKQVYRAADKNGNFMGDVIGLEGETMMESPFDTGYEKGKICYDLPMIHEIQRTTTDNLARLAEPFKRLKDAKTYPVIKSNGLEAKRQEVEKVLRNTNVP